MRRFLFTLAGAVAAGACAFIPPILSPAQAAELDTIRAACAAIGLQPSEAPFAYCVQSLQDAVTRPEQGPGASTVAAVGAVGAGETRIGHRSEYACAAIGISHATARYSYCVTNLKQTLFDAQNVLAR